MLFIRTLLFLLLSTYTLSGQRISDYISFTGWGICRGNGKEVIIIRKFIKENHCWYLTVSPQLLTTEIINSDSISISESSWENLSSHYSMTPYICALKKAEMLGDTLQDAGFTRFMSSQNGIDLTVDLCPSQRSLDRNVFNDLIREMGRVEKPVPLAVSITGRWINRHPADLKWLDSLALAGDLSIIWINHSYNHYTVNNVPLKKNFMLTPGTDINSEVLRTEIALLQNNIEPSIFFRFPGLVSDQNIYKRILGLGLIPIGSDAWLAKGQWPKNGSIVLIHANGNEPLGVQDFINLLKNKRTEVLSKRWELYDLRESLVNYETR